METTTTAKIFPSTVSVTANIEVPTLEAAQALAAEFPKTTKVRATTLTSPIDGDYTKGSRVTGIVTFQATTASNGVNGGTNETGIRRLRSFRKALAGLGISESIETPYSNSLSADEFEEMAR